MLPQLPWCWCIAVTVNEMHLCTFHGGPSLLGSKCIFSLKWGKAWEESTAGIFTLLKTWMPPFQKSIMQIWNCVLVTPQKIIAGCHFKQRLVLISSLPPSLPPMSLAEWKQNASVWWRRVSRTFCTLNCSLSSVLSIWALILQLQIVLLFSFVLGKGVSHRLLMVQFCITTTSALHRSIIGGVFHIKMCNPLLAPPPVQVLPIPFSVLH